MWILVDVGFLVTYLVGTIAVIALGAIPYDWWFMSGHPCACPEDEKLPSKLEERQKCPRHNNITEHRHFLVGFLLGCLVVVANFVAMLELFHYLHLWR